VRGIRPTRSAADFDFELVLRLGMPLVVAAIAEFPTTLSTLKRFVAGMSADMSLETMFTLEAFAAAGEIARKRSSVTVNSVMNLQVSAPSKALAAFLARKRFVDAFITSVYIRFVLGMRLLFLVLGKFFM